MINQIGGAMMSVGITGIPIVLALLGAEAKRMRAWRKSTDAWLAAGNA